MNPRPVADEIVDAAKSGLHASDNGFFETTGYYRSSVVKDYQRHLSDLFSPWQLSRPNLRWLDIGAGFGQLVTALRVMLPSDATVDGLEPSEPKRQVAKKHGVELRPGTLTQFEGGNYDVVSMINVLSHLPEPKASIFQIRGLLRPGGILVLLTGNLADCTVQDCPGPLDLPDHLVFFGRRNLVQLLMEAGFEVEMVREYEEFFHQNGTMRSVKNLAKRILGRPLRRKNVGPSRDLFVRAVARA